MNKIITVAQLQKEIGEVSSSIDSTNYIVTKYGKGKIVLLPYFDGCNESIEDYIEDYEMAVNKEKLRKKYVASSASGKGNLTI